MISFLRTLVCNQPKIALYFESKNELKLYNLVARSFSEDRFVYKLANRADTDEMTGFGVLLYAKVSALQRANTIQQTLSGCDF